MTKYIHDKKDIRNHGNLIKISRTPNPNVEANQKIIETIYTYDPSNKKIKSVTNSAKQTTTFNYDDKGNIIGKRYPSVTTIQVKDRQKGPTTKKAFFYKILSN